jgi:RimJ/RimL family protein N-acetyltransferase
MAPGVRLRELLDEDLPILFEFQRDPVANQMAAFIARDPSDRDAFDAHWRRIRNDARIIMRTILLGDRVVGNVASYIDEQFGKREVTYWIGRDYWGEGIATEALFQFLRGFPERPIYGRAAKDNTASIRVMEKCGFVVTGQDKSFANARGKEIEEVILELKGDPPKSKRSDRIS